MTEETLEEWLHELRVEHRDLDDMIQMLETQPAADRMQILRLKKRGLGPRRIANQINSLYKGADMNYSRVRKILDRKFQGLPEVA